MDKNQLHSSSLDAYNPKIVSILDTQKTIPLINDEGKIVEELNLEENDPIYAYSFRQLIKSHFEEGKHFFVAKIVTRDLKWSQKKD